MSLNLVTGAAGHVGNVLIRELVKRGESVRALVLPGEDLTSLSDCPVEIVDGNVLQPESLEQAVQGVDTVFHLAGVISIMPGKEKIMHMVNVQGVQNVVNAARKANVRKFVHTSSIHAFKRVKHGIVVDEKIPLVSEMENFSYDGTKAEGMKVVLNAVEEGLNAVIVCPTGIIGPHDYRRSEMGQTIWGFARKKLSFLIDGAYDFVDVRDIAVGLIQARNFGRVGETYILSGEHIHIRELFRISREVVGNRSTELVVPYKLAYFISFFAQLFYRIFKLVPQFTPYSLRTIKDNSFFSNAKARRELKFNPRPLTASIKDTILWWQQHLRRGKAKLFDGI